MSDGNDNPVLADVSAPVVSTADVSVPVVSTADVSAPVAGISESAEVASVSAPTVSSDKVVLTQVLYVVHSTAAPIDDFDKALLSKFSSVVYVDANLEAKKASSFGFEFFPLYVLMDGDRQLWKANTIPTVPV